jgi:glycosyltransferase involved in cell wall biosynthesis
MVCTGATYRPHWPAIEAGLARFGLSHQVRFVGFLAETDLRAVFLQASALVLPSLYEASSLPIFEAWQDGVPVACSNATALPEQVRGAALLFDPTDVRAIAEAVKLVLEPLQRSALTARGRERLGDFDLVRTAKAYRAVYRRAGDFPLTDEDRWLLSWDWMQGSPSP